MRFQYAILTGNSPRELSELVNTAASEGWTPHGSPFVVLVGARIFTDAETFYDNTFCQAMMRMVREEQ